MAPSVSQVDALPPLSPKARPGFHSSHSIATLYDPLETHQARPAPLARHDRQLSLSNLSHSHTSSMATTDEEHETVPYVFPDFQALSSIFSKEEYKPVTITGFEIYIVEQWACERRYSTVITSYTGDSLHKIKAGRVHVPRDTAKWSDRLTRFIEEIEESGSKLKQTENGFLFITNLSSFPSHLNLIPVSGGCAFDVWDLFKVNVNMRRLQCGGRSALFLSPPSDACEDKFRQIYMTHPKVDITYSVKELVTLVQICLVDFKLLDPNFVDGLLCNKTEEKIMEWWNLFGSLYYGITPKDGLLGPTTLSAILGFVLSCLYRLDMASVDFPKEPFNYFSFRVNVGKFQKAYNLARTWYLDPITVDKLFRVTSKTSTSDISKIKKVVKSTVHDISGKLGSEQSASDVLTTDLEKAIKYFNCSPRLEYLWFGKGDSKELKQFDYYIARSPQASALKGTSTLRSGVGKIRSLPKRLQGDETSSQLNFSTSSTRQKHDHEETFGEVCDSSKIDDQLCELFQECTADTHAINLLTDDETFKLSLRRRLSFPYLCQDVNTAQLSYENHNVSFNSNVCEARLLRRSKSFSLVEDVVLDWETFVVAPEFIAERIRRVEKDLLRDQCDWTQYCQEMKTHKTQLERSRNSVFKLHQRTKPLIHQCDLQLQADERFHSKLSDIEATGARLEYEMRLLSTRVRDTQDSVDNFVNKVEQLRASIMSFCPSVRISKELDGMQCTNDRIDKQRINNALQRIQDFGLMKWLTSMVSSFNDKIVEDGDVSGLEIGPREVDESEEGEKGFIMKKSNASDYSVDERLKQS